MSIDSLTQSEALENVRETSSRAIQEGNLDLALGSNGKSGRLATGNYSLLAKATGISRVHIGKVLSGKVEPSYRTLKLLHDVTGISLDKISEFIQTSKQVRE